MKARIINAARLSYPLAAALAALLSTKSVDAANGSWASDAAGSWATATSWTGSIIPGSTSTDNPDVATFNNLLTAGRTVTVDTNRFIGGLTFGATNTSTFGYTLSGGSLRLNSGGTIQTTGAIGNNTTTISSPIQISGVSAATASFTSSASTAANGVLSISGGVTGSATASNTTTLTLNGSGTGANTVSGIIGNGSGGGVLALTKSGTGTWALSGANTFSGGATLSAGTLTISNAASLGSAALTVSGTSTLRSAGGITYTNAITVNAGLTLSTSTTGSSTSTYSGLLSGSSAITLANNNLAGSNMATFAFTHANNTFTGNVILPSATGSSEAFSFASIGDGGNITFNRPSWRQMAVYNGAAPIVFNTRQISLASTIGTTAGVDGNGNPVLQFSNNSSNSANTVTFNTNMVMPASSASSTFFSLGGSNTGNNTFAGVIGDIGGTNTLGIIKWDAGKWILSHANNAYEGNTWIGNGTLSVASIDSTANNQPLGRGALILLGQSGNSGALEITGAAASTTNKQIQIGNATAANTGGGSILNEGSGNVTFANAAFNTAISGITAARTLTLGGSGTGLNTIQGVLQNNATGGLVNLTKSGSGTWVLAGTNTFSGSINVTNGTLAGNAALAFGAQSSSRTITIASGATLRYDVGNIYQSFSTATVPTFAVTGTLMNNFANNNALGNVTLTGGTITATAGSANYGAFRFNGTVTSTGNSTISTSDAVSGRMMLRDEGSAFNVSSGTLTISAPLAAVVREGNVGALVKDGAGALALTGANTYSGSTTLNGGTTTVSGSGTLGSGVAALAVNNASTVLNLSTTQDTAVGSLSGTGTAVINNGGTGRNFTVRQTTAGTFAGTIAGSGNFTLAASSTHTLSLSGSMSFTGSTRVNGGTLRLAYSANTSKLSNTAALVMGGGAIELSDSGTPHTEEVASTTLTAGTASRVTRSSGTSVLQMNAITVEPGAFIDFAADNIASTDTLNTNGILGSWATVGGTNWATNSTNTADGPIIAYSAYTDIARLDGSTQVITNNNSANVRIIEGTGSAANIVLGSPTTVVNSLLQSDVGGTGAATIAMSGQTLRTNAVLVSTGAGALTIGTAPNNGTLSTATPGGSLMIAHNGASDLTVNSVISNNTSASGLGKLGTGWLVLTANNTYTGPTDVAGGVLYLSGSIEGSAITTRANAELRQDTAGLLSGATSLTLTSSGTSTLNGANTHTGGTTLTTGNLVIGHESALGTGVFTINGGGLNTDGIVTSLTTNNAMTWNGNFSYNGASALNLGNGSVTLGANSQVNVSSNTLTVGGVIGGAFSLTKTGAGTLVLNAANVHSGGTFMSGSTTAGTLILGHAGALGTGPVTFNSQNDSMIVDTTIPNFVNANNNAFNFQGHVIFAGSQNMDLGTGPVTLLGNRTVTISANTLKIGGGIGGAFTFTKAGSGQLIMSGVNTYTGSSTFNGSGSVTITGAGSLGAGNYSAAITNNSGFVFESTASQTLSGVISGTGSFTKSAGSTLTLTAVNTFTGPVAVNNGTLIANVNDVGNALSTVNVAIASGATAVANITTTAANASTSVSNIFTGAGELRVQFAAGTTARSSILTDLSGFSGLIRLSSLGATGDKWNATSAGPIPSSLIIDAGNTVYVGAGTGLSVAGGITLNGSGNSEGRGAIRLSGATLDGDIQLASSSTINFDNASAILTGNISNATANPVTLTFGATSSTGGRLTGVIGGGTGTLNVETAVGGTYILEGENTYSGLTTVAAGSLVARNAKSLGSTASGSSVANGARLELDNVKVEGESITIIGNGTNFFGALQSRSGNSEWAGNVLIDAEGTRIGSAAAAALTVSGVIDDGPNDYRVMYRVADAAASVTLTGANTYTGVSAIVGTGPVIVGSLNRIVGGTASSHLGAPTTVESGRIIIGTTTVNGTLRYVGAGETTDRSIQIGENAPTPVVGDIGGAIIQSEATTTALQFSSPIFNIPTNAATGTTPTRTLTLSGSNTNANTISGMIQNNQIAGNPTAAVNLTKSGSGSWTLAGPNVYTGTTTINEDTLVINNTYNVAAGGTTSRLLVGATSGFNGALTIGSSAGVINFGGDDYANAVQVGINGGTGSITMNGGTVSLVGTAGTTSASLNIGVQVGAEAGIGAVTVNNGTLNVGQRILLGANNLASNGTLTVAGGSVDVGTNGTLGYTGANPGVVFFGSGTATVNLDGGSLNAFAFKSHGAGTSTINFNGGTLVAKGSPSFFLGNNGNGNAAPTAAGVFNTVVKSGGAIINTNGFNVTIPTAMVADAVSSGGGLTKTGAGTLTLTGMNTYKGNTLVSAGTLALIGGAQESSITVSAGASLGFTLGSPTTSTSTFNLSAGTIKITGTPTLNSHVLITSSAGITGTPTLDAPITGYDLKVDGNSLLLVKAGYASWASVHAISSLPGQDKDNDGVSNAIEYVLGGTVTTNDLSKLPTANAEGANLLFTFRRSRESIDGNTTVLIEVGNNLSAWPDVFNVGTTTANSSAGVVVTENTPVGFDTITLTVPKGTDLKKFGRLKVTVTE